MKIEFVKSSLMEESLAKIRDENTIPAEFRKHLRRIGRYLIYEVGKNLEVIDTITKTPIAEAATQKIKHEVVIISVLRAALPMVDAILEEVDNSSLGVISASRDLMKSEDGTEFEIKADYVKLPTLENKVAIIVDPMLATGSTIKYLLGLISDQNPAKIIIISAIASKYGINLIESKYPAVEIYTAVTDEILNEKGYIVPGLGDAGDRACNTPHL
ncbi:MAG: uracil phosphoribosyltransferase [Candidatus Heimdallarchaeota archaeon]|nr:uracil phosphoribosyltransferase [Candidatus Heimdallarchaeota archaeon]